MEQIIQYLIRQGITITTMESCTSGLLASHITDYEGSSAIFKGSFVTYSNGAKIMQGVPEAVIDTYGVYSSQVAVAMAKACRETYQTEIGIGVTGTTGNVDPNNEDSVSGEIFYGILWKEKEYTYRLNMDTSGLSRHEIKEKIVCEIEKSLKDILKI